MLLSYYKREANRNSMLFYSLNTLLSYTRITLKRFTKQKPTVKPRYSTFVHSFSHKTKKIVMINSRWTFKVLFLNVLQLETRQLILVMFIRKWYTRWKQELIRLKPFCNIEVQISFLQFKDNLDNCSMVRLLPLKLLHF
jgi:hypothetical protein